MPRHSLLSAILIFSAALLAGCATTRSELQLSAPGPSPTSVDPRAPTVQIRAVKDRRVFEEAPKDPSIPSLGFEGAAQAAADVKARAVGRKRNTFGAAMGDIVLREGQTVEGLVRSTLTAALMDVGLRPVDGRTGEPASLIVDVDIGKFWAWVQPGFAAITLNTQIQTELRISTRPVPLTVAARVAESRQIGTESAWMETIEKALQAFRQEARSQLQTIR